MDKLKNYYRNLISVISDQGVEIDEGSLWWFNPEENRMILVDDDEYHSIKSSEIFEKTNN